MPKSTRGKVTHKAKKVNGVWSSTYCGRDAKDSDSKRWAAADCKRCSKRRPV